MFGISREQCVIGVNHFTTALAGPFHRRTADGKGRLGVNDVVFVVDKLLN